MGFFAANASCVAAPEPVREAGFHLAVAQPGCITLNAQARKCDRAGAIDDRTDPDRSRVVLMEHTDGSVRIVGVHHDDEPATHIEDPVGLGRAQASSLHDQPTDPRDREWRVDLKADSVAVQAQQVEHTVSRDVRKPVRGDPRPQ